MPQTVHIFREHEAKIDFGSVQCRASLGAPLLSVFSQARLAGQAREHLQKEAIQGVIGGRTQIRAATVPAPLASVVPARQSILEPVNSLFKQTAHHRISSFDIQFIKTDKRGHETVENARNRSARNLRVQGDAINRNPTPESSTSSSNTTAEFLRTYSTFLRFATRHARTMPL